MLVSIRAFKHLTDGPVSFPAMCMAVFVGQHAPSLHRDCINAAARENVVQVIIVSVDLSSAADVQPITKAWLFTFAASFAGVVSSSYSGPRWHYSYSGCGSRNLMETPGLLIDLGSSCSSQHHEVGSQIQLHGANAAAAWMGCCGASSSSG